MDFSSALANLKRSAESSSAASSTNSASHHPRQEIFSHPDSKRPRHSSHDNRRHSQENALRKALMTLPHYRPPAKPQPGNKHVCLLFITIDDLPYEDIWKEWATAATDVTVSIVVHAKFPDKVKSDFVKQRLLVQPPKLGRGREYAPPIYHSRRPDWGSIEITRAMLDLCHEGLRIGSDERESDMRFSTNRYRVGPEPQQASSNNTLPPVDKFIFCSETCIPVATLQETAAALFSTPNNNTSWVNGRNTPNNGYSRQLQFEKVDNVVPQNCIYKADQWMVLSRAHAVAVMELDRHLPRFTNLWQCFTRTNASDEMYFPTSLSLLGIMPSSMELEKRRVTYADWSESAKNPASFAKGVEDLKRVGPLARKEGCLFARKFTLWNADPRTADAVPPGRITVDEWKECMQEFAQVTTEAETNESSELKTPEV